ncbi:hypothetical protein BDN71DRAFT_1498170 [Pleurotus eryngii]|uniref:Uncharacterized protein n=1 Tax=Pleurotus eryngii TaxID=5323 RepID=A0A9P6D3I5_PLEER|nr:hypothetical protein BDN71DRAFT_1498170 [Pleurotus eryngii]
MSDMQHQLLGAIQEHVARHPSGFGAYGYPCRHSTIPGAPIAHRTLEASERRREPRALPGGRPTRVEMKQGREQQQRHARPIRWTGYRVRPVTTSLFRMTEKRQTTVKVSNNAKNDEERDGRGGGGSKELYLQRLPGACLPTCPVTAIPWESLLPSLLDPQTAVDDSLRTTSRVSHLRRGKDDTASDVHPTYSIPALSRQWPPTSEFDTRDAGGSDVGGAGGKLGGWRKILMTTTTGFTTPSSAVFQPHSPHRRHPRHA